MFRPTQIAIPSLVRVKPGAIDRVGIYLSRADQRQAAVLVSEGLIDSIASAMRRSLEAHGIETTAWIEVADNSLELAARLFVELPGRTSAIIGLGGGRALDVAKYVAFLARRPFYAVPTSLSNDGFCSPQSSLTVRGQRRTLPAALPGGVIVDTRVCGGAPRPLLLSGVGDLVAKFTAVTDWKLAFHALGEPVNDFACLLSDSVVHAFRSHPAFDAEGIRLLASGLMLNGIAMEIAGSSRPASGSEHLISHALDQICPQPRLHGLQVGVATYLISRVQGQQSELIDELFAATGFWTLLADEPFSLATWREAIRLAPQIKQDYYTVLTSPANRQRAVDLLQSDPRLAACFVD